LKIGILLTGIKDLSNWQLRIINAIIETPTLELVLLVTKNRDHQTRIGGPFNRVFSKIGLGGLLLALQGGIEKRLFFKPRFCVDGRSVYVALAKLDKVEIGQRNTVASDQYKIKDRIKTKNLDLLINLGLEDFPLDLIHIPKYGVWEGLHSEFSSIVTTPVGFSEVLQRKPVIGFTLLKHSTQTEVELVDQAFFNREWSMFETATIVQEGGVSVLLKNLKRLQAGHKFDFQSKAIPRYKRPGPFFVLKYMALFYKQLLVKIKQKLAYRFLGKRRECWSVFLGEGRFLDSSRSDMKPLKMPKDEFWADPFLFQHQGTDYVFFENYSYRTNRGKISCGKVKDQELYDIVDVLDLDYHLSFPFIFEEDGVIFLMPETSENKRLEVYRAVDFPMKWELYTTAFEGEMVADAFFYDDPQDQKWLFVNKQSAVTSPMNSELFIYKTDSIKLKNLQAHAQNPVIIDARVARNGGAPFRHNSDLYRPSQRNTDGIYGRALNINRIKKLTIDSYEEETIHIFEPDFHENLMATHHLHQTEDLFVFDAAYRSK
jgi:hypothetical protein